MTRCLALLPLLLVSAACSSKDAASNTPTIQLVDSNAAYGKSYAEWAADWIQYISSATPPDCIQPIMDDTGANCNLLQDEKSPVFFLVGNYTGVAERDKCHPPADKALFFPLLNVWGDNAGVPEDMLLSAADIKSYIRSKFEDMMLDSLYLRVDGTSVEDLGSGAIPVAPYRLELAPNANSYVCSGQVDVQGEFPGYLGGYWAMLPPLSTGKHRLEFGGKTKGSTSMDAQSVDQTYVLTIE